MPHNRFCNATANPNTSRPHPLSMLIGCRKRPKLWRMPSASVRITLAQTSMTAGLGLRKSGIRDSERGKAPQDITQGAWRRRLVPLEIRSSTRRDTLDRIDHPALAAPAAVPEMVAAGGSLDAES